MSVTELPPALRPWSESLAFLTVEAALHIGPLVRRLDTLVRRHDAHGAPVGDPDGYGGLTTRGQPERLLLSEWLLADELPLEFMRRAAERELLHVEPAFRAPQGAGRVAVFCDVGPDQLGAPRLVQLAALIVLHRRALARGTDLRLGFSGEYADTWHGGALPELFTAWRRARRVVSPSREELDARLAAVDAAEELWVLAGSTLASCSADVRLLLHTRESAWDAEGVSAVEVRFEGRATTLHVPPGPVSVRTLRGEALRRVRDPARHSDVPGALGPPSFPSVDERLLARGERPNLVVAARAPARVRVHHFSGPVLAATSLGGRRIVALVLGRDERVRCEIVGRKFAWLKDLDVALEDFELDPDDLEDALPPLYFDRGDVLVPLLGRWWRVARGAAPRHDDSVLAVGPYDELDLPDVVRASDWRLAGVRGEALLDLRAGNGWLAWPGGGGNWQLWSGQFDTREIMGEPGETLLGVLDRGPALITCSEAGLLVRMRSNTRVRTLTACSGPALARVMHPQQPLLAIQREPDAIEVINLHTDKIVQRVGTG